MNIKLATEMESKAAALMVVPALMVAAPVLLSGLVLVVLLVVACGIRALHANTNIPAPGRAGPRRAGPTPATCCTAASARTKNDLAFPVELPNSFHWQLLPCTPPYMQRNCPIGIQCWTESVVTVILCEAAAVCT